MAEVTITKTLDTSPDVFWTHVRNFGDLGWMPGGGAGTEVRGEGVGQVRILKGPDGEIHERLEAVDEAGRSISYTIPIGLPFPATDYYATVVVGDEAGKAHVSWTCRFEPDGAPEEEVSAAVRGAIEMLIGWIDDYAQKG